MSEPASEPIPSMDGVVIPKPAKNAVISQQGVRQLIIAYHVNQRTIREVAEMTCLSYGTVHRYVSAAGVMRPSSWRRKKK